MNEFTSPNSTSGTALIYCAEPQTVLSVAQALLRWKMCTCVGRGASMLPPREIATQQIGFSFELAPGGRFVCTAAYSFAAGCARNTRANIQRGAGKNCSGRRTMDLFVVVIIAAMFFTVATVF